MKYQLGLPGIIAAYGYPIRVEGRKTYSPRAPIKSARQKEEIAPYLTDHIPSRRDDIAELLGVKSTQTKKLLSETNCGENCCSQRQKSKQDLDSIVQPISIDRIYAQREIASGILGKIKELQSEI